MDNYLWNVECDHIITPLHKPSFKACTIAQALNEGIV